MTYRIKNIVVLVAFLGVLSIISSCSSGGDPNADLSGTWKSDVDGKTVVIKLDGEKKYINLDNTDFAVTKEKIENDTISLDVVDGQGKNVNWKLIRVWDDNGTHFTLNFFHDGTKEKLKPVSHT